MPELSRFFGIIIAMYYNDHAPPHFHAKYASEQATILIDTGEVLDGSMEVRSLRLIEKWRLAHHSELIENWTRAQSRQPLNRFEPLE